MSVFGAIDMLTAPCLESGITACWAHKPTAMVIDLRKTEFLASAGIGVLLLASAAADDRGVEFAVVADAPATSRPITLLGLQDALHLHANMNDALAVLKGGDAATTSTD